MTIDTFQINPKLLKCSYFNFYDMNPPMKMYPRVCYDYELEYFIRCDGGVVIDGNFTAFQAGDINIRKPGQTVCGIAPYECYALTFDMTGTKEVLPDYIFGDPNDAQPRYEHPLLSALSDQIHSKNPQHTKQLFQEICILSQSSQPLERFHCNEILHKLLYEIFSQSDVLPQTNHQSTNLRVTQVVEYIQTHFCDDINISEMILQTGLSSSHFHKCFRDYTGKSPSNLITSLRIEKAKNLLCMTNNTISEITYQCGYFNQVYFSHLFKQHTKLTPSQYRHKYTISI